MLRLSLALLMISLVVLPTGAAEDVRVSETRIGPAGPGDDASYQLRLNLHLFRGSRWQPDDVVHVLPAVSALLAQCGIGIVHAEVKTVDAPRRFHFYSTPVSRELLRTLAVSKPAVFFVDETLNRPAYDAETIGLANAVSRPELAHTIWVAYGARDLPLALAHELMHLLANSGEHSADAGNLLREETSQDNTALTAEQCALARMNGEAQGLLVQRR